jgi:pimeloyl-ACP methyl ester carboxylesterase
MSSLRFTAEASANGMIERDFTIGDVPGVLWSPTSGTDRAPILLGHGGGNHKKHPAMAGRAQLLVTGCGFHVAVIDAPGHGDRSRTPHDEEEIAEMFRARAVGEPEGPIVIRYNAYLAELAVPEWQATLDALQELPKIGTNGQVGYYGINMGDGNQPRPPNSQGCGGATTLVFRAPNPDSTPSPATRQGRRRPAGRCRTRGRPVPPHAPGPGS